MKRAPFGTWNSPLAASDLARSSIALNYLQAVDGALYWVESRPAEGGRNVLVTTAPDGGIRELTPAGYSARSRVHEYGGTPYAIGRGALYFSNFSDQRVYELRDGGTPTPLTPAGYRYADYELDPSGEYLFCVREDHTGDGEPKNAIVALDTAAGGAGTVLFDKSDFVAYPRLSRDGRRLAWIAWNHPDMPWDTTTLYVADVQGTRLSGIEAITAGTAESVMEPRWGTDGTLYFLSDRSNWWNLYRYKDKKITAVHSLEAEIGSPLWTLGQANYALTGDGRAVVRYTVNARDKLGIVDLESGKLSPLLVPFIALSNVQQVAPDKVAAIAATPTDEAAVVTLDIESGRHQVVRAPASLKLGPAYISVADPIEFPTAGDLTAGGLTAGGLTGGRPTAECLTAHAFYYPPTNPDFAAAPGEKPPLVVKVHGGPTSHSKAELALTTQFWTSRGFALLDVNHGGSSGFGRAYRQRLNGNWGIVDVGDVVAAVRYLIDAGRIDGERAAIRGGSAGGFTVLATLAFHDVFKAGANYYGVSDLEALAHDTHKFESRYLDRLVAPLPEGQAIYEARAPIRHLEGFKAALITFQGTDDKVVPPNQSRAIVAAVKAKGLPVEYIEFEGELHGFRKAESIVRSLEAELAFYGKVFGFTPSGAP